MCMAEYAIPWNVVAVTGFARYLILSAWQELYA